MMFKEIKEIKKEDRNINNGFDPKAALINLEIDEDMKKHIKELWKF